jgi:hypothetical protein
MVRFVEFSDGDSIDHPLVEILYADMFRYQKNLDEDDSQFSRWAYYRGAFAYLEGHAHSLRAPILKQTIKSIRHGEDIPILKITALMIEAAEIGETGTVKNGKPKVATAKHIAFVFNGFTGG